jgi:hypothetical protein
MRRKTLGLLTAVALAVSACGGGGGSGAEVPADPDAPVVQVHSEGGFLPVEISLGRGPRYTLLADGRLIHEGPVIAIYPGPLLPNYLVSQINEDQMNTVLELVDEIGLPGMENEIDDSAASFIADASTEVVTYWDTEGEHTYSVYALGIEPDSSNPSTTAFTELLVVLDQFAAQGSAVAYEPEQVRVIAGVGFVDPEFTDVRDWPLDNIEFSDWETLPNGWMCTIYGPEVLDTFADASQTTQWTHPDPMMDAPAFTLLVRPLHPGEPNCPNA